MCEIVLLCCQNEMKSSPQSFPSPMLYPLSPNTCYSDAIARPSYLSTAHFRKAEKKRMGSRLGRRVVNFANIPIKLLMPSSFSNITEISLKTIPSASKIEIKRVLESLYGFEVEKVQTLNMDGKKKKRGGLLIAKPDYKKAYVTLKNPLSISRDLFPIRTIEVEKKNMSKKSKSSSIVEDDEPKKMHWLDEKKDGRNRSPMRFNRGPGHDRVGERSDVGRERGGVRWDVGAAAAAKFPWSSMRSYASR